MTLSHAVEQTPNILSNMLIDLDLSIKEKLKQARAIETFEIVEKALHAAFVEAERVVLCEILSQYDIDVPFVMIDDKSNRG